MAVKLTLSFGDSDIPESHCDGCDMRFNLAWNRNPEYDGPMYCPFCGDDIDWIVEGDDAN